MQWVSKSCRVFVASGGAIFGAQVVIFICARQGQGRSPRSQADESSTICAIPVWASSRLLVFSGSGPALYSVSLAQSDLGEIFARARFAQIEKGDPRFPKLK